MSAVVSEEIVTILKEKYLLHYIPAKFNDIDDGSLIYIYMHLLTAYDDVNKPEDHDKVINHSYEPSISYMKHIIKCLRPIGLSYLATKPKDLLEKKKSTRLLFALHDKIAGKYGKNIAHRARVVLKKGLLSKTNRHQPKALTSSTSDSLGNERNDVLTQEKFLGNTQKEELEPTQTNERVIPGGWQIPRTPVKENCSILADVKQSSCKATEETTQQFTTPIPPPPCFDDIPIRTEPNYKDLENVSAFILSPPSEFSDRQLNAMDGFNREMVDEDGQNSCVPETINLPLPFTEDPKSLDFRVSTKTNYSSVPGVDKRKTFVVSKDFPHNDECDRENKSYSHYEDRKLDVTTKCENSVCNNDITLCLSPEDSKNSTCTMLSSKEDQISKNSPEQYDDQSKNVNNLTYCLPSSIVHADRMANESVLIKEEESPLCDIKVNERFDATYNVEGRSSVIRTEKGETSENNETSLYLRQPVFVDILSSEISFTECGSGKFPKGRELSRTPPSLNNSSLDRNGCKIDINSVVVTPPSNKLTKYPLRTSKITKNKCSTLIEDYDDKTTTTQNTETSSLSISSEENATFRKSDILFDDSLSIFPSHRKKPFDSTYLHDLKISPSPGSETCGNLDTEGDEAQENSINSISNYDKENNFTNDTNNHDETSAFDSSEDIKTTEENNSLQNNIETNYRVRNENERPRRNLKHVGYYESDDEFSLSSHISKSDIVPVRETESDADEDFIHEAIQSESYEGSLESGVDTQKKEENKNTDEVKGVVDVQTCESIRAGDGKETEETTCEVKDKNESSIKNLKRAVYYEKDEVLHNDQIEKPVDNLKKKSKGKKNKTKDEDATEANKLIEDGNCVEFKKDLQKENYDTSCDNNNLIVDQMGKDMVKTSFIPAEEVKLKRSVRKKERGPKTEILTKREGGRSDVADIKSDKVPESNHDLKKESDSVNNEEQANIKPRTRRGRSAKGIKTVNEKSELNSTDKLSVPIDRNLENEENTKNTEKIAQDDKVPKRRGRSSKQPIVKDLNITQSHGSKGKDILSSVNDNVLKEVEVTTVKKSKKRKAEIESQEVPLCTETKGEKEPSSIEVETINEINTREVNLLTRTTKVKSALKISVSDENKNKLKDKPNRGRTKKRVNFVKEQECESPPVVIEDKDVGKSTESPKVLGIQRKILSNEERKVDSDVLGSKKMAIKSNVVSKSKKINSIENVSSESNNSNKEKVKSKRKNTKNKENVEEEKLHEREYTVDAVENDVNSTVPTKQKRNTKLLNKKPSALNLEVDGNNEGIKEEMVVLKQKQNIDENSNKSRTLPLVGKGRPSRNCKTIANNAITKMMNEAN